MGWWFFGLAVAGLLTLIVGVYFNPEARAKRALAARPRALIGEGTGGKVHVVGRVRARGELLHAPVSGRSCVAYQLFVTVGEGDDRNFVDVSEVRPFTVIDETGEAVVETGAATAIVSLETDREGLNSSSDGMTDATHRYLLRLIESRGIDPTTLFNHIKLIRYREGILEEGETVSVGGLASRDLDLHAQSAAPRALPTSVVIRGTSADPLVITDDPEVHGPAGKA